MGEKGCGFGWESHVDGLKESGKFVVNQEGGPPLNMVEDNDHWKDCEAYPDRMELIRKCWSVG